MTAGLTQDELWAVEWAIRDRMLDLDRMISRHEPEAKMQSITESWRNQREALNTALPKLTSLRRGKP